MLIVLVAGLWLGVARFGLLGAVGTVVLVSTLERLALIAKFGRVLGVSRRDAHLFKDVLKIAVAAAASAGVAALVRAFMPGVKPVYVLAATGVAFVAAYLACILLLKVVREEEFEMVRARVARLQRRAYWKRAADPLS